MSSQKEMIVEWLQIPSWDVLKSVIGDKQAANFMYMASYKLESGTVVHTFKHSLTRRYINLSDDGSFWKYMGGSYAITDRETAIQAAAEA
jgi:hypothetical protein